MRRPRALQLAALLAPLCAVALARVVMQTGPAAAVGARQDLAPAPDQTAEAAAEPTAGEIAALAWVQSQKLDRAIPSPLALPPEPEPAPEPQPEPAPEARPHPTAALTVSVIIGGGESGVAKINGRLYQVGDEVVSGWFITNLRPRQQEVELADPSGEVVTLSRHRP